MKIKLLFFTILLLFVTLSSELMALEIPKTNETELVIEENKNEKEIEKQDFILQDNFQLTNIEISSTPLSTLLLYNYFYLDNTYKPPIYTISS
jgi:hypothetical protein